MSQNVVDRERALQAFHTYAERFDPSDTRIRLKIHHIMQVAGLCEQIAKAKGITGDDLDVLWLIGVLHDIGRFEQLKQYGTFSDAASFPHAIFGADLLFQDGLIRAFIEDTSYDALIESAVRRHSDYVLPDIVDEKELLFCNIIRDADKIDILRIVAFDPIDTVYGTTHEALMQAAVTEDVAARFFAHTCVDHKYKKTPADYLVGDASLLFVLAYPESRQIAKELDYHRAVFEDHTDNPDTAALYRRMSEDLALWLDGQTSRGV